MGAMVGGPPPVVGVPMGVAVGVTAVGAREGKLGAIVDRDSLSS